MSGLGPPGDASYAAAFRAAGLDVDALGTEVVGAGFGRYRRRWHWNSSRPWTTGRSGRRRARPDDREGWGRLIAAARAADRDVVRNQVREVWEWSDRQSRDARLLDLARQAAATWSPATLRLLANALAEADLNDAAVALIRRAFEEHPRRTFPGPLAPHERPDRPALDEAHRLAVLRGLGVLDTGREAAFDALVACAARLSGCPISLIGLVDADRLWFKASVGLDLEQLPRERSCCDRAFRAAGPRCVEDLRADERFAAHPLVTGAPGLRFYAGQPLCIDGAVVGR